MFQSWLTAEQKTTFYDDLLATFVGIVIWKHINLVKLKLKLLKQII